VAREFVCTTTIWIEAGSKEEAFQKLEAINRRIVRDFGVYAASDPDRVSFEGNSFPDEVECR